MTNKIIAEERTSSFLIAGGTEMRGRSTKTNSPMIYVDSFVKQGYIQATIILTIILALATISVWNNGYGFISMH
jgi:hypothetical protein